MGFISTIKSLWEAVVEGGRYLVSEFITNKDTSRWIKDFDKYQEYTKQLQNPYLTETDSSAIQSKMISDWIIDPYLYTNYITQATKKAAKKAAENWTTQTWVENFRTWLTETVKDNYIAWDKYQREVLNKAIDELTKQYQMTAENVETTYNEFKDEKLKQKRDELRPEYEKLIQDSAKKYAQYINEWLNFNQAYRKLIDEGKAEANRIVQIQNELRRRQDRGAWVWWAFKKAADNVKTGRIDKAIGNSVLWIFNIVNGALNMLGEWVEETKQALGWYDVLEELNSLNVYKDSKPILNGWRTIKNYGYEIIDWLPQLLPAVAWLIVGNKATAALKLEQVASQLIRGGRLLDTAVDVSRAGKFIWESLQDFMILDAVAQPLIWRPMTSQDFIENWIFNIPINAGIAAISKWLKYTDKIPQRLLNAMWTDGEKLSKEYIDYLKTADPEDAALAYFWDLSLQKKGKTYLDPNKAKLFDEVINSTSLPAELQVKHNKVIELLQDYNKRIEEWAITYNDIVYKSATDKSNYWALEEIAEWDNILKTFVDKTKSITQRLDFTPENRVKLTHGSVINLYNQWVITANDIKTGIESIEDWFGKDIMKWIWLWDKETYENTIRSLWQLDDVSKQAASEQILKSYNQLQVMVIDKLYKSNPTGKRQVGQYINAGDGTLNNVITNKKIKFTDLVWELTTHTADSITHQAKFSSQIKNLYTDTSLQQKNIDGLIKLPDSIYQGSLKNLSTSKTIFGDVLALPGGKWEINSVVWKFSIKAIEEEGKLSFYISEKWLEKLNNTLEYINTNGWNFIDMPAEALDAYKLTFLKQYMYTWKIQATAIESSKDSVIKATTKPKREDNLLYIERLYKKEDELGKKALDLQRPIDPNHAIKLNEALNKQDFDEVEIAAATIQVHDAIRSNTLPKVLESQKDNKGLVKTIESLDWFRVNLPEWLNIDKEISEVIWKVLWDWKSNNFILTTTEQAAQKKVYTITVSKLITQNDSLLVKFSDAQSAWTEVIKTSNPEMLALVKDMDLKLGVDLTLADKIANVTNIGKIIDTSAIAKNWEAFNNKVMNFKKKLQKFKWEEYIDVSWTMEWEDVMKLFIANTLQSSRYYSEEVLENIYTKFKSFIWFVNQVDNGYKVVISNGATEVKEWMVIIWREDISRFTRTQIQSKPEAMYNALFQSLEKQVKIDEALQLWQWELSKYIKWDIKPNLLSDLIKDFNKTIKDTKVVKSKLKEFINIMEPNIIPTLEKYPSIVKTLDDMIENWTSVQWYQDIVKLIYSNEWQKSIDAFTSYLFKLNEVMKEFGWVLTPNQTKKVLEKAQGIEDILNKIETIWISYNWLTKSEIDEVLTPIAGTTNTKEALIESFGWWDKVISHTGMDNIQKTITNELAWKADDRLSKAISKNWIPKVVSWINIINTANAKVSPLMEWVRWWIAKNVRWKKIAWVNFEHVMIGEDAFNQRTKLGWDKYMPFDIYIVNKLTAEILNANWLYSVKNVAEINSILSDKTKDLVITNIGRNYNDITKKLIADWMVDNGYIDEVNLKDIPDDISAQIASYKLMDRQTGWTLKDAEDKVAWILISLKRWILNKSDVVTKSKLLWEDMSFLIEDGFDESMVDTMVDSIYDTLSAQHQLKYNIDILGKENKPFGWLEYNLDTYRAQTMENTDWMKTKFKDRYLKLQKNNISLQAKVRQLGIDEAMKRNIIKRADLSFGKMNFNLNKTKRDDLFSFMITSEKKWKDLLLEYTTEKWLKVSEQFWYEWVWWWALGKWFKDKLWLKDLPDRRVTRQEIYQAMRDSIYKDVWFNWNIKDTKFNKNQSIVLNTLNKELDMMVHFAWDANGFTEDALRKVFNTNMNKVDLSEIWEKLEADDLRVTAIVPRYNIVDKTFEKQPELLGEEFWTKLISDTNELYEFVDDIDAKKLWWELEANREADRYIIKTIDNTTGKEYIWVMENIEWQNVFKPYTSIEPQQKITLSKEKSFIEDIKIKENLDVLEKDFIC